MNREIGRSGDRVNESGIGRSGDRMNEGCIGIWRLVDPEIELVDQAIGRSKQLFSRSADHPLTRSNAHPTTRAPEHPITRSLDLPITRFPHQEGFTLFEVLVSMTLTGFLMVALLIGLRVANRAWQTGEARLRLVHAAAERNAFLVKQIASLVPYQVASSDPQLPGRLTVLQSSALCLRFISSYSSIYRGHSGLVLVEYGIVHASRGNIELALRETPVGEDDVLYHKLVRSVTTDPETGVQVINYRPFSVATTDLRLMTGLSAAWFEYLDLHPKKGAGPVWREDWQSSDEAPYPDAIRLRWERAGESGEELVPVRAR